MEGLKRRGCWLKETGESHWVIQFSGSFCDSLTPKSPKLGNKHQNLRRGVLFLIYVIFFLRILVNVRGGSGESITSLEIKIRARALTAHWLWNGIRDLWGEKMRAQRAPPVSNLRSDIKIGDWTVLGWDLQEWLTWFNSLLRIPSPSISLSHLPNQVLECSAEYPFETKGWIPSLSLNLQFCLDPPLIIISNNKEGTWVKS